MITLTNGAAKKIKEILTSDKVIVFGVLGGGCAGFEYDIQLVESSELQNAEKFESNGVEFYVDKESLMFLLGTEIDYKTDIISSQFVFSNPLATASCGCGTSFAI